MSELTTRKGTRRREAELRPSAVSMAEGAETVRRLLDAAARLMRRDGEIEPNMRDLLREAGVSTRAFYRHFPTKTALISVMVEEIYNEMLDEVQRAVLGCHEPEGQLKGWVHQILNYAVDPELAKRGRALVLQQARVSREYADVYNDVGRALNNQVLAILKNGIAQGAFRSDRPVADARMIVTLTIANLQRHVLLDTTPNEREADDLSDFVLRTLR